MLVFLQVLNHLKTLGLDQPTIMAELIEVANESSEHFVLTESQQISFEKVFSDDRLFDAAFTVSNLR